MTIQQRNKTNILVNLITSSGIISMCIYGFISYGRMSSRIDNFEAQQKKNETVIDKLDEKKADKEEVMKMWEDVKYIRYRIDQHMNQKSN